MTSNGEGKDLIPLRDLLQASRLGLMPVERMSDGDRAASTAQMMTLAAEVQCRRAERVLKVCAALLTKAHEESTERLAAARELGVDELVAVEAEVERALAEAGREVRAVLKENEDVHAAWLGTVKR